MVLYFISKLLRVFNNSNATLTLASRTKPSLMADSILSLHFSKSKTSICSWSISRLTSCNQRSKMQWVWKLVQTTNLTYPQVGIWLPRCPYSAGHKTVQFWIISFWNGVSEVIHSSDSSHAVAQTFKIISINNRSYRWNRKILWDFFINPEMVTLV